MAAVFFARGFLSVFYEEPKFPRLEKDGGFEEIFRRRLWVLKKRTIRVVYISR